MGIFMGYVSFREDNLDLFQSSKTLKKLQKPLKGFW